MIFILVDALRPDHLSSYGYLYTTAPKIDGLAREGVLFERVIASSSWTKTSMASIVTSRDPDAHGVRRVGDVLPEDLLTLAEAFSEAGYYTAAVNTNPWVTASFGFHRGYDVFASEPGADATRVNERALELLGAARRPFFLCVHYMDVHAPYVPNPRYFDDPPFRLQGGATVEDAELERLYRKERFDAPGVAHRVRRLYDAGIRETDAAIGALIEELGTRGLLDDAIVVLTSDHGEGFREHGTTEHGWNLYPEVYEVPLVFRAPGRLPEGRRVAAQVRSIDLAPTLVELAGIPVPAAFEGRSLLPLEQGAPADRVAIGAVGLHDYIPDRDYVAVVTRDHLYIRERRSGAVEFYDLREDPQALRNLGADHPEAQRLAGFVGPAEAVRPDQVELAPETRAWLRALGYLDEEP